MKINKGNPKDGMPVGKIPPGECFTTLEGKGVFMRCIGVDKEDLTAILNLESGAIQMVLLTVNVRPVSMDMNMWEWDGKWSGEQPTGPEFTKREVTPVPEDKTAEVVLPEKQLHTYRVDYRNGKSEGQFKCQATSKEHANELFLLKFPADHIEILRISLGVG